jgi:hypothetical protein
MNARNLKVVVFGVLVVVFAAAAFAAEGYKVKANVPFDFVVNGQSYPAGQYLLTVNSSMFHNAVLILGPEGNALAFVHTTSWDVPSSDSKPYLVFRGYNDRYFLNSLYTGTLGVGVQFPRSREEKEIVATLRAKTPTQVAQVRTITIAAQ